jgi:hypothetical protein
MILVMRMQLNTYQFTSKKGAFDELLSVSPHFLDDLRTRFMILLYDTSSDASEAMIAAILGVLGNAALSRAHGGVLIARSAPGEKSLAELIVKRGGGGRMM